jgi:hypothetical protein
LRHPEHRFYRVIPERSFRRPWTQTNFDALGRTVKTTLQDSSVSTSSYTDNTVTVADPAGKQRKGASDALGRLTGISEPDPTNGNTLTLHVQLSATTNCLQLWQRHLRQLWLLTGSSAADFTFLCG